MTREEAIQVLRDLDEYFMGRSVHQVLDMAIEALEQEPILSKIRAEIKETANKIRNIRNDNLCFFTEQDVLEIIDKYRRDSK